MPITPIFQFDSESPYHHIILKREDVSDGGSHKFRYFEKKLVELQKQGVKQVVLSTTGNAGITAAHIGKKLGMQVFCLMSDNGDLKKAAEIQSQGGYIFLSSRPVRFAKYLAKKLEAPLLKTSVDGAEYYHSLGEELIEQVPDADMIVNFATSGSSSVGIIEAFEKAQKNLPELHVVQAGKSCSIAREFLGEEGAEWEEGVGLSDTPRREEVLGWIEKSGGKAWYVRSEDYEAAQKELIEMDLETSWEGAACFWVAQEISKHSPTMKVVVIFSGRNWLTTSDIHIPFLESLEDIDSLLK